MTIIDDYLKLQEEQVKRFNETTLLFMQVGHFYEAYAVDNAKEKSNADNVYRVADILNIQVTRKNKNIQENSRGNPIMIGVNLFSIEKHTGILMEAGYTLVIMEQVGDPPNITREITRVYSPGTYLPSKTIGGAQSNYLLSVFLETAPTDNSRRMKNIGMSVIDFATGKSVTYEVYSKKSNNDFNYALDETFRFIQVYNPSEVIFMINDSPDNIQNITEISHTNLLNYLNLNPDIVHFFDTSSFEQRRFQIGYQRELLEKVFNKQNETQLSIIEFLDLETSPLATISFVNLVEFAYTHNETIIQRIKKPVLFKDNEYLLLTNNSINQLNLIPNSSNSIGKSRFNSLLSVIDKTSTSIGKRYLKDQLLNPISNADEINNRYSLVHFFYKDDNYKVFQEILSKITDLEKYHRRITMQLIQPADFYFLDYSYSNVFQLLNLEPQIPDNIRPSRDSIVALQKFKERINNIFDISKITKYHTDNIDESFFNKGFSSDIDEIQDKCDTVRRKLDAICKKFSKLCNQEVDVIFKLDYTDRDGYSLSGTQTRCKTLKAKIGNYSDKQITIIPQELSIESKSITFKNTTGSKTRIDSPEITGLCHEYRNLKIKIGNVARKLFGEVLREFDRDFLPHLYPIIDFIGNTDIYKTAAQVAHLYGYHRPTAVKADNSYITAKELRHPIIERIQTKSEYVPNDIQIGTETQIGMLLYGTNASGKSSLMKAVGLNIILAQAGFYTASSDFQFSPYKHLFTRILNNDNIFKGESSFAVEVSEIRSILKRCDNNSLVLGDELCNGTENISAQSIFASCVITLSKRYSNFIFATHLHGLMDMEEVKALDNVKAYHLKVEFDKKNDILIYDRKIQPGNGPPIYGLEVCKAMDLEDDFIQMADKIRRKLLNVEDSVVPDNKSKYNAQVYVDKCGVCQADADDVHHIKFQCTADSDDIIDGHIDKNVESNLVPLCKKCHTDVHNNKLQIDGYKQTSKGVKLQYHEVPTEQFAEHKQTRKKYNTEIVEFIKQLKTGSKLSNKNLKIILEKEHDIKISQATIIKIINDSY